MESTLSVLIIFKPKKMPDYLFVKLSSYQWVVNIKTKMIAVFFAALGMAVEFVCK
jgi:hypothetical protein